MHVVGLTGGIASGKTAVSDRFAALGAPVIDTDVISREVVARNTPGLELVRQRFGQAVLAPDGLLDRQALRALVFEDAQARRDLEAILHPRIQAEVIKRIDALNGPYCVVVVPLLVGSDLLDLMDTIVTVDVPESVQIQRLKARDGGSEAQAQAILAAQASRDARLAIADHVITNTGSLDALYAQVDALDRQFRANRN